MRAAANRSWGDAESLIRLHDALIFLRAYPHGRRVRDLAERLLLTIGRRVAALEAAGEDLSPFDAPEVAGIAGTTVGTDFSFDLTRWLARRFPRRVKIDWAAGANEDRMRGSWPDFLPLLEEEALADANVAYLDWLAAAAGGRRDDPDWILRRYEGLRASSREIAERFDALGAAISWELGESRASRTLMRVPGPAPFFHDEPFLSRRDVSLDAILSGPRLRAPEALPPRRPEDVRPHAGGDDGALPRVLHVHPRRPDFRRGGAPGAGRRALSLRRAPGAAPAAAVGLRRLRRQERSSDRIHRGAGPGRAARDRLQHVLHVPGGGVGLDLRPGLEAPPRRPGRDVVFDRSLSARLRERGGPEVRCLLVLPQARLPADTRGGPRAPRSGGAANCPRPVVPLLAADARASRPAQPDLRRSRGRRKASGTGSTSAGSASASTGACGRGGRARTAFGRARRRGWPRRCGFRCDPSRSASAGSSRTSPSCSTALPGLAKWTPADRRAFGRIVSAKANRSEREYLRLLRGHGPLRSAILRLGSR